MGGQDRASDACRVPTQPQTEVTGQGCLLQQKQEAGPDAGLGPRPKCRAEVQPSGRPGAEGTGVEANAEADHRRQGLSMHPGPEAATPSNFLKHSG